MKLCFRLLSFFAVLFCITSCFTDDANYYVKYEATVSLGGVARVVEANYTFNTDKGSEKVTMTERGDWSETFGPVKKGFVASLSGSAVVVNIGAAPMTLNIYVCRGEEPFALKAQTVSPGDLMFAQSVSASVSYTIDF